MKTKQNRTEEYMNEVLKRLNRLSKPFDVVFERNEADGDIFTTTIIRGLYESFSISEIECFDSDLELTSTIQYRVQRAMAEILAFLVCKNSGIL